MATRTVSAITWKFPPKRLTLTIDRPLFKGPKPLAGREQVVAVDSGGWQISYEDIPVYRTGVTQTNNLSLFKAHFAYFYGYGNPTYVRVDYGPFTIANRLKLSSNPTSFKLSRAHAKRDTTLYFTNPPTTPLIAGDYIEIDGRIHTLATAPVTTGGANNENSVTVWPPLRAAYASNLEIEVYDPRVLCYIATDSRGGSVTTSMGTFISYSVDFIEASW